MIISLMRIVNSEKVDNQCSKEVSAKEETICTQCLKKLSEVWSPRFFKKPTVLVVVTLLWSGSNLLQLMNKHFQENVIGCYVLD